MLRHGMLSRVLSRIRRLISRHLSIRAHFRHRSARRPHRRAAFLIIRGAIQVAGRPSAPHKCRRPADSRRRGRRDRRQRCRRCLIGGVRGGGGRVQRGSERNAGSPALEARLYSRSDGRSIVGFVAVSAAPQARRRREGVSTARSRHWRWRRFRVGQDRNGQLRQTPTHALCAAANLALGDGRCANRTARARIALGVHHHGQLQGILCRGLQFLVHLVADHSFGIAERVMESRMDGGRNPFDGRL